MFIGGSSFKIKIPGIKFALYSNDFSFNTYGHSIRSKRKSVLKPHFYSKTSPKSASSKSFLNKRPANLTLTTSYVNLFFTVQIERRADTPMIAVNAIISISPLRVTRRHPAMETNRPENAKKNATREWRTPFITSR